MGSTNGRERRVSEAHEVRKGLQAAATALAGMALQQDRIADMLATWDKRASWEDGMTVPDSVYVDERRQARTWASAAAELRAAIAPSSEDIRAALAKLEARAQ
jgi:hypothetical protein